MATASYTIWGLFPLYFKSIHAVAPAEILVHRVIWAMLFLAVVLTYRRQWAVNNGRVVDSSLGYFITPLVNVLLGFILLRERLRPIQWLSVAIAACGVIWLAFQAGHLPWISLALAFTFGTYGLLRKTAKLGALEGLSLETLLLLPFSAGYLIYLCNTGNSTFASDLGNTSVYIPWLLVAAGPVTAIPLLLFAAGARRIPLSTLGLLQYISPTLQLLLGICLYHEAFNGQRLSGFLIIWFALLIYSAEGIWRVYKPRIPATTAQ